MTMSGSNMAGTIETLGIPLGMLGDDFPDYCEAVGNGTIDSLVGAPFTTTDSGTTPNPGNGTGTGLLGVVGATISAALVLGMTAAFGGAGPSLPSMCLATAEGFAAEMLLATLTSTHAPVCIGAGIVDIGSISVPGAVIGAAIALEGVGMGFVGANWADVADVIGTEFANALLLASGAVVITGVPPGTPVTGIGVGAGSLS